MPLSSNKRIDSNPIVELEHLFFSYPSTAVLKDVSFKVYPGEFVGLIGPNGGGKTTLLKLILGFLKPTSGAVKIFSKNPAARAARPGRVAYVPQSIRFDRDFPISVEEVVLLGLLSRLPWHGRFREAEREATRMALEKTGLSGLAKHSFGSLSGGQAQRVLIARALVSNPQLLLLDEPTASVDSRAEADIFSLLSELKGEMTILMVTHDLAAAMEQVGRILCVQGGVLPLKPEEVCNHFTLGLYHNPFLPTVS